MGVPKRDDVVDRFCDVADDIDPSDVDRAIHTGDDDHAHYFLVGWRTFNEAFQTLVCLRYFQAAKPDSYQDDTLLTNGIQMRAPTGGDGSKLYDALAKTGRATADAIDNGDEFDAFAISVAED